MRIDVDAWDPSYGTALSTGESSPTAGSSAEISADVEMAEADWAPVTPRRGIAAPEVVLLVDGVRRVDAQLWITGDDGTTEAGLVASYAAGVVRCDSVRKVAEVAAIRIARGLFTPNSATRELRSGSVSYPVRLVGPSDPQDLTLALQRDLADLEKAVSISARGDVGDVPDGQRDLLVVDGPLRGRAHLARTLGYIKTHRVEYLPGPLSAVVTALRPGQRCPVFLLGTSWHRYTWYLRLPGQNGGPWAGIVRVECSADLTVEEASYLADQSATTLPRLASSPYKDPRAPQNLIPIAGLERRLRALLGDPRLLYRGLLAATRGGGGAG